MKTSDIMEKEGRTQKVGGGRQKGKEYYHILTGQNCRNTSAVISKKISKKMDNSLLHL